MEAPPLAPFAWVDPRFGPEWQVAHFSTPDPGLPAGWCLLPAFGAVHVIFTQPAVRIPLATLGVPWMGPS